MLRSDQKQLERRWRQVVKTIPLRRGPWRYSRAFRDNEPAQGWKLHLSATLRSASQAFALARPVLRKHGVLFKVPDRLEILAALNSGFVGFSQIGKFLTAYTHSDAEAVTLARELHAVTRKLEGPQIPFDVRYRKNSVVYYRYGAFLDLGEKHGAETIVDSAGGIHTDVRDRAHAVPSWRKDPFQRCSVRSGRAGPRHPFGIDLLPIKAITQRGKGGVYEAVDLSVLPVRRVIIKEGRRHGETNWDGRDGYALVKHEAQVLRESRVAGLSVPEVFREFTKNGNRHIVLEQITDRPLLATRRRIQPSRTSWRRSLRILEQLEPLLSKLHAAGWVWRDCKPSHLFLRKGELRAIDFEGACRIGETDVLPWGSPDYIPPEYRGKFSRRAGTLEDDYALGVIAFQFLSGTFPPSSSRRRASIYKSSRCPDSLRDRIESLLQT